MNHAGEKTVRLLSRSGLFLLFLSMAGSFTMATLSVSTRVEENSWNELFGVLFLTIMGISVYYIVLGFFGWYMLRRQHATTA